LEQDRRAIVARLDQKIDTGVLCKNRIIQFAKLDSPIFTEKTYAQNDYRKGSGTFLGMIKGVNT
jgi:hypothetical protein